MGQFNLEQITELSEPKHLVASWFEGMDELAIEFLGLKQQEKELLTGKDVCEIVEKTNLRVRELLGGNKNQVGNALRMVSDYFDENLRDGIKERDIIYADSDLKKLRRTLEGKFRSAVRGHFDRDRTNKKSSYIYGVVSDAIDQVCCELHEGFEIFEGEPIVLQRNVDVGIPSLQELESLGYDIGADGQCTIALENLIESYCLEDLREFCMDFINRPYKYPALYRKWEANGGFKEKFNHLYFKIEAILDLRENLLQRMVDNLNVEKPSIDLPKLTDDVFAELLLQLVFRAGRSDEEILEYMESYDSAEYNWELDDINLPDALIKFGSELLLEEVISIKELGARLKKWICQNRHIVDASFSKNLVIRIDKVNGVPEGI